MRSNAIKSLSCAAVLVTAGACYFLSSGGVALTVRNVGTESIESMVVQATGFSRSLGTIAVGQTRKVQVAVSGKSRVELEHAGGPRLVVNCYFESGQRGSISVDVAGNTVIRKECALRPG